MKAPVAGLIHERIRGSLDAVSHVQIPAGAETSPAPRPSDPLQRDDGLHDQYDADRPTSDWRLSRKTTVTAKTRMTRSQQPTG